MESNKDSKWTMGGRKRSICCRLAARWTGRVLGGRARKSIREITEPLISCAATEELPVPAGIPRSTCMLQPRPPNTISGHDAERRTNAIRLVPGSIPSFEQAKNRTNNDDDVVVPIDQSQNRRLPSSFVRSCPNRARHVDERLDLAKVVGN